MRGLAIAACLFLPVVWTAEEDPGPRFFRPLDKTAVPAGRLSVAARGGAGAELFLDGETLAFQQPGPGALTAVVSLAPGRHVLRLKDGPTERRVEFFATGAGAPEPPAGYASFRVHPPATACEACHQVRGERWGFKGLELSESCLGCHEAARFSESHQHTPDALPDCQLCHQPHGAAAPKLLKLRKEIACKQCHG